MKQNISGNLFEKKRLDTVKTRRITNRYISMPNLVYVKKSHGQTKKKEEITRPETRTRPMFACFFQVPFSF